MNIYPFWRIHSAVETASDNRYDTRFDFDFATSLLLDAARERSLDGLMGKLIGACLTLPEIAGVEARLIEKGDQRCQRIKFASNGVATPG
jgi:hypothetical protein